MARCFAAAMSHAPGLRGTPSAGHCSSAATSASCASSSAMPISRTIRAKPAISRADSIFHTASMARCVSVAVTVTDHNMLPGAGARRNAAYFSAATFKLARPFSNSLPSSWSMLMKILITFAI